MPSALLPCATSNPLSLRGAAVLIVFGAACFHAAYYSSFGAPILGFAFACVQLARLPSAKVAFRAGLILGWLCFVPQMFFLWNIFGRAAPALWTILAIWVGVFTALAQQALARCGPRGA